ncbi:hypothetical protein SUDANB176_00293 [Streptomyces sp. enrichment culture]
MWDFPGGRTGGNRYLVLGLGTGRAAVLAVPPGQDELVAYGPLFSDDGATWLGTAALVRAPDPDTARAVLTPDRYVDVEVHNWQFGGRPSRTDVARSMPAWMRWLHVRGAATAGSRGPDPRQRCRQDVTQAHQALRRIRRIRRLRRLRRRAVDALRSPGRGDHDDQGWSDRRRCWG